MKRVRSDSTDSDEHNIESDSHEESEEDSIDGDEIEDQAEQLSKSIPRDKALDFLHTLASSKSILYWNSYGEMMYRERRIPVTNMAELIEYAMLPYNLDVKTPRGLKTFTEGLSEIGIDKKLIRNKKLLADLVARQHEEEDQSDSESDSESKSAESENSDEGEEEEETDQTLETVESEISDSDDEPKECHVCRDFKPFYEIPVLQCPRCLWREGYYARQNQFVECHVCTYVFAADAQTTKVKFCRCQDCGAVHQLTSKRLKLIDSESESESN